MAKILKVAVFGVCAFMLVFMFIPTGNSASDVLTGYQSTLVHTTSGALPYQYMSILDAGDPLLEDVAKSLSNKATAIWCLADGTPVESYTKTDSFPRRGGDGSETGDYIDGDDRWHRGTDLVPQGVDYKGTEEVYQVALFDGVVEYIGDNLTSGGWGRYVVLNHGNNFYTLYAHLGYGPSNIDNEPGPNWQSGKTGHSAKDYIQVGDSVKAGDIIGAIGNTGGSYGTHSHVELIIAPNGYSMEERKTSYYYAGLDNLYRGGKSFEELTWHHLGPDQEGYLSMVGGVDVSEIPGVEDSITSD